MEYQIQTIEYPGLICLIYTNNDITYVNVSKWAKNRRDFSNWFRSDNAKNKIEKLKLKLGHDQIIVKIANVRNEYKGSYVHVKLAIHIASWIDSDFCEKVYSIFNYAFDNANSEIINHLHQMDQEIAQKDLQIDILTSKYNNKKKELHDRIENIQMLQDALKQLSANTVPTDAWNKFAVFKIDDNQCSRVYYKAIRCRRDQFEKYCKYIISIDAKEIYGTELPNGIEYFSTFRDEYARNNIQHRNIVNTSYNDISLKVGIDEHAFIEALRKHRSRIDVVVNSIILNETMSLEQNDTI